MVRTLDHTSILDVDKRSAELNLVRDDYAARTGVFSLSLDLL